MASHCFACGNKIGIFETVGAIIEGRHELCDNCYKKLGTEVTYFKLDLNEKKAFNVDETMEAYENLLKKVDTAGFSKEVENAIKEDINSLLEKDKTKYEVIKDKYGVKEQRKALQEQEKFLRIEKEKEMASMLITSGFTFDGYRIVKYSGYISGDDAIQIDRGTAGLFINPTNVGDSLMEALTKIRRNALKELKEAAYDLGCNAVIGVDFDYITLDPETANTRGGTTYLPYVFGVTANGNAVIIEKDASVDTVAKVLREYKELADSGIITEEEFQLKKRELLNLN